MDNSMNSNVENTLEEADNVRLMSCYEYDKF
jgi:hypothetical protein